MNFPSPHTSSFTITATDTRGALVVDPWGEADIGEDRKESWLLSYIDILMLFLTLLALLLVVQPESDLTSMQLASAPEAPAVITREPHKVHTGIPVATPAVNFSDIVTAGFKSTAEVLPTEPSDRELLEIVGTGIEKARAQLVELAPDVAEELIATTVNSSMSAALSALDLDGRDLTLDSAVTGTSMTLDDATEHQTEALLSRLGGGELTEKMKVSPVDEGVQIAVNNNILFAPGRAELKAAGRGLLDNLIPVFMQHDGMISVEGHTDNQPISNSRFPSNWELSSARANGVTRYLIAKGLDAQKLRSIGYADTRPLTDNRTEAARAENRRVALILRFPRQNHSEKVSARSM